MRQVTHALLTRPPLTFKSLGFIKSPFDLHVLSTPPAFILSQDQTLMFKFILPEFSGILQSLDWFTVFLGCDSRHCSLKYSFGIFQGCITVYLSRFLLLLFSAATLIEYHMSLPLSTTFLIFFRPLFVFFAVEFHNITLHS